ncbi:MAG: CHAT domain-containing protein [Myxococcales bacterium]|nr:CHAT domain-containing protein [Myxococcales bacterium]
MSLLIETGETIDGHPRNGFRESRVTLRVTDQSGTSSRGRVSMDWGGETLNTHRTVAQFLDDFWSGSTSHNEALEFGQSLLRRLLEPKLLADSWNNARQRLGEGRLRLEFVLPADNPDLWEVPFELLADEHGFLCYDGRAALIRCFPKLDAKPAELQRGHRLLIAWANPKGLEPPVDDEPFKAYARLFSEEARNGGFEVPEPLAQAGPNGLRTKLQAGVEVFSLMAHGQPSGGRLLLEAEDRSAVELEVGSLAADLSAARTKVALLWACHGGRAHRDLGSFAHRLLHRGLAAVVATHGALRAKSVASASQMLFGSLVRQGDFEQAVNEARQTLQESDVHWAALAYYARPRFERSVTFAQAAKEMIKSLMPQGDFEQAVNEPRFERSVTFAQAAKEMIKSLKTMPWLVEPRVKRPLGEDAPPRPAYWVDSSRERELAEILTLLRERRLVTLLGMPGVGKTELAREAGERIARSSSDYQVDSVHWFSLDELGTTARLLARLARWANLEDTTGDESKLLKAIGARRALWVLDNAEDLLREPHEASALATLLSKVVDRCPRIRLLLTSQRSLPALPVSSKIGPVVEVVEYVVQRIENEHACFELFRATCASSLAEEHETKARALVEILYGHPSLHHVGCRTGTRARCQPQRTAATVHGRVRQAGPGPRNIRGR